jgi:predicted O-methyltransferase YrrM
MSYHGYVPSLKNFLCQLEAPTVLEIGLDRGVTTIPLVVYMSSKHKEFHFFGIDVNLQETLLLTLQNLDRLESQKVLLTNDNSLVALPSLVKSSAKFDLILIDGDHNYYTVSRELSYLDELSLTHTIVLIDDYNGTWSETDMWYSERPGYEENLCASKRIETEKHGVKAAVDDFLIANSKWEMTTYTIGEPVVLTRKKIQ